MSGAHTEIRTADLNLLSVFDALRTERSVSRAAQKLGLSQSGMSRALARLREQFGDELFVRSGGTLVLTARAESLVAPVRDVLSVIEERILQSSSFDPETSTRTFCIATADYCEALLMPALLSRNERAAPHITLRSVPTLPRDVQALVDGDVAFVIALCPEPKAGIRSQTLLREHFVSLIRADHRARHRVGEDLELWCNLPHVAVAPHGQPGGPVDDALAALGRRRRVAAYVQSFLAAPMLAAEANALTTLPASIAQVMATKYDLAIVPLPFEVPGFKLVMSWYERWHKDPGHAWLRRQFTEVAIEISTGVAPAYSGFFGTKDASVSA